MNILIACEESARVRDAFRAKGHNAISCDLLDTRGNAKWHFQGDVLALIRCPHLALSGRETWDMMIAHPPCTHICVSGARHFEQKRKDGRQKEGISFFMNMINAPIDKIAVENPVGIMSSHYRKPSQVIQPYYFGDDARKTTCLWLKNLNPLQHNEHSDLFWIGENSEARHSQELRTLWPINGRN